jgi:hypothetical protein
MCGTATGTGTVLIYFLEQKPEVLHKNKELPNTGFWSRMQNVDNLRTSLKNMTSPLYQIISSMQFIQFFLQVWVKFPNNFTYMHEANNQT